MFEIFRSMFKEEWRIHSSLFGNISFGAFPFLIIAISFILSLASPVFRLIFSDKMITAFTHYMFFFLGTNVGAFGLSGKEFMNRRFGQASVIAYASRTLPISDRTIFFNNIIKDITYYLFLIIFPIIIGFAMATPIVGTDISEIPYLLISLPLAFMIGLSIVFFLSMLYAHSIKLLTLILFIFAIIIFYLGHFRMETIFYSFFPIQFFLYKIISPIFYSILLIITLFVISIAIIKVEFPDKKRTHRNLLPLFDNILGKIFGKYGKFIAKDFIDMARSTGGIGKMIFSFTLPVSFLIGFLTIFTRYVPQANFIIFFAVFLGIFSASFYSWVTEYDAFNQYLFFPVKISEIIKSKILSYLVLSTISISTLIIVAICVKSLNSLIIALAIYIVSSAYSLSLTILLTGLSPGIMFMNVKNILVYFLAVIPVMIGFIFSYIFAITLFYILFIIISAISVIFFIIAIGKWDKIEQRIF